MYKAVTLAGGIREPLLTCSSFKKGNNFCTFPKWSIPLTKELAHMGANSFLSELTPIKTEGVNEKNCHP